MEPSQLKYAGLGAQLAATLVLSVLGGQWLDRKLGTGSLFVIVLAFVGFAATLWWLVRQLNRDRGRP